ncbi:hypothetical protein FRX31_005433 [Thalictrum thalictroides]|uniref:Uncharacterized protein n=1 Tax=Thalictrum thalictroides TaxID=46969 RepID=A0A7J6X5M8_THATH|nr:hypothetical protein FRX31_005433 [Thalictrum thalictroides]
MLPKYFHTWKAFRKKSASLMRNIIFSILEEHMSWFLYFTVFQPQRTNIRTSLKDFKRTFAKQQIKAKSLLCMFQISLDVYIYDRPF